MSHLIQTGAAARQPAAVATPPNQIRPGNGGPFSAAAPASVMFGHRASAVFHRDGRARGWGSAAVSIAVHIAVAGLLSLSTWAAGSDRERLVTEFQARIVPAPSTEEDSVPFRFGPVGAARASNDVGTAVAPDSIDALASLLDADEPIRFQGTGADRAPLQADPGRPLGRADVIGLGGSAAATGSGRGLRRASAGVGGRVGSLWGVGEGQRARSIVYVLDRSGSMQDVFPLLKRELKKAIGELEDDQEFNVIWFRSRRYEELSKRLVPATLANKRRAFGAINDIQPEGHTNPMDALRRGFEYRPDVLFLISDADFFPNNEKVVRLIAERNRRRQTTVNTILIVYDTGGGDPRIEAAVKLFRSIAEDNNGVYKRVRGS